MTKPKVLIIAYACNPERQSEFAIGWNFVAYLSRFFQLSVLTRAKNKNTIETYISNSQNEDLINIDWYFYDLPKGLLTFKKYIGTQFYFKLWLLFSYQKLKNELKSENFDIVNHLNFGVVWMSSPYYRISKNFIWGPIGGSDLIPYDFLKSEKVLSVIKELFYSFINWYGREFSITNKLCRINSEKILFRTEKVAKRYLGDKGFNKNYLVCETGFSSEKIEQLELDFSTLNAVVISRMDYWKGIIYAVKGFEKYINAGGTGFMTILGSGNEFNRISNYITSRNLSDRISLKGKVTYSEYLKNVANSNVLIYPSFRDGGSFTVLESMAMGVPIICSNNSGPSDMVGVDAGFIIDTINPEYFTNEICNKLLYIEKNPTIAKEKGALLRKRALDFYTWDKRGEELKGIYNEILKAQ